MQFQEELIERGKSTIQKWRAILDELEVQLALGKAEAKETLQKEKETLSRYISDQKAQLVATEVKEIKKKKNWKEEFENLYMLLNSEWGTTKTSFKKKKEALLHSLHQTELDLKEHLSEVKSMIGSDMGELKEAMDTYRIKLALSTEKEVETLEDEKDWLQEVLERVINRLNKQIYPESKKIDYVLEEISESFEHLKRAFTEILN
ncbi:MAG: hypothetical protein KDE26_24945 [Bacteroidetes bacterium]|nr:hypothetical protein [Bacteroidota bacterium]MCB0846530.1 hypothetical protein [Bacteroidota bacterium]